MAESPEPVADIVSDNRVPRLRDVPKKQSTGTCNTTSQPRGDQLCSLHIRVWASCAGFMRVQVVQVLMLVERAHDPATVHQFKRTRLMDVRYVPLTPPDSQDDP